MPSATPTTEPLEQLALTRASVERSFRASDQTIYSSTDIDTFINRCKELWLTTTDEPIPNPPKGRQSKLIPLKSDGTHTILQAILENTKLQKVRLPFPYRTETRYTWGDAATYSLIQSLAVDGYFSHYTAMQFHGLTDQISKTIYFNVEQPAAAGGGKLTQEGINRAFQAKCRTSKNIITLRDMRVCRLNGGNTHQLGVIDFTTEASENIRLTDIERTLIDAVVRPVYSGGIGEVAEAFRLAADKLSIKRLIEYLRKLKFTYPYHQAIGYYLERAGVYKADQIEPLRKFPIEFDFYLNYQLKNPAYNERWKLFLPQRF